MFSKDSGAELFSETDNFDATSRASHVNRSLTFGQLISIDGKEQRSLTQTATYKSLLSFTQMKQMARLDANPNVYDDPKQALLKQ